MSKQRAGGIFASSFVAGVLLAAAICAPRAWEPVPGPTFDIDDHAGADAAPGKSIEAAHAELFARMQAAASAGATATASYLDEPPGDTAADPPDMPPVVVGTTDPPVEEATADLPPPEPIVLPAEPVVITLEPVLPSSPPAAAPPERIASTAGGGPAAAAAMASTLPPPPQQHHQRIGGGAMPLPAAPPEGLKALANRVKATPQPQTATPSAPPSGGGASSPEAVVTSPSTVAPLLPSQSGPLGAAPLPGEPWSDPDGVNWADVVGTASVPAADLERRRPWMAARHETRGSPAHDSEPRPAAGPAGRILDRFRGNDRRLAGLPAREAGAGVGAALPPGIGQWPRPVRLEEQLDQLSTLCVSGSAGEPIGRWTNQTRAALLGVSATRGPRDATADFSLVALGETVIAGMSLADATADASLATPTRRAALAVARRVAVWRSTAAICAALDRDPRDLGVNDTAAAMTRQAAGRTVVEITQLLDGLERFETTPSPAHAAAVRHSLTTIRGFYPSVARSLERAVEDHYLAPNVRIAVHQRFLETLLPGATVDTGPFHDTVMGREVRGTRTVERTTVLRLVPDEDEICLNLEVHGDIASRAVTDSGPVSVKARSASAFTVRKPIKISTQGLLFGNATGSASNRSHVDAIQTSFDAVPVMGSLVRSIAKNQQEETMPEANREVIDKIITRACREVDTQAEPQFAAMADRVRDRVWMPLVRLGLEPKAVAMQTTPTVATMRLRLAGEPHLAAHTPRPRVPADAMLSLQIHESSANNTLDRLGLAGRRFTLEELIRHVCGQIGVEPTIPEELPEGVSVTFASQQPLRLECRDGLLHVAVALDAIESGRRDWYDLVTHVAYKPVCVGPQVFLEREGPIQLRGKAHEGRMELALRTIFGKIFPKERKIAILPDTIAMNPKLADMQAVQAVSSDGWLAIALEQRTPAPPAVAAPPPAKSRPAEARRRTMFR